MDITVSAAGLVLLAPIIGTTAVAVRVKLGKPILFKHLRPGRNREHFQLLKFRTMTDDRDQLGNLLPDVDRVTKFGAFLRTTSLDELPELINILKGDMSLVGPRPLLTRYLPYYTDHELHRFRVRPGLTGLAQIQGRNSVTWNERLSQDAWYSEHLSFKLDVQILFKTLQMVLKRQGVVVVPNRAMKSLDEERAIND